MASSCPALRLRWLPFTRRDIRRCARTFDEFIYRFWLEDEIAWKLGDLNQAPLTDVERRFLDHYQQQSNDMG